MIFVYFLIDQTEKNGGTCFDNEGTAEFSCTCTIQFDGERCEDDLCKFYPCQNNGTCFVDLINGEKTPVCDCPRNTVGPNCNLLFCDSDDVIIPCYNRGTCKLNSTVYEDYLDLVGNDLVDNLEYYLENTGLGKSESCQCSQENGIDKYYGVSCDMPAACDGSPCQNGGSCTKIIQGETQACFIKKMKFYQNKSC